METPHDILKRIQQDSQLNTIDSSDKISPHDMLSAIQSAEVQNAVQNQAVGNDNNMLTDLLGGGAIGFGNMLNNVIYGATGQLTRNLGRLWESVSPFSGEPDIDYREFLYTGASPEEIRNKYPYENSWLTSPGNASLAAGNYFGNILDDTRKNWLGQNPTLTAKTGEGLGSILAFIPGGLYAKSAAAGAGATGLMSNLLGAATSGGLESLSESGGFLLDAYGQGKADDNALDTANKNFIANLLLNTALDATLGRFNPKVDKIANPFYRWLASGALELANENLQEPSQSVIEQASQNTLNNPDAGFLANLGESAKNWGKFANELWPEVSASTALSHLLPGPGEAGMRQHGRRKNARNVERHKHYLPDTTTQADTKKNSPTFSDDDNIQSQKHFYDTFIPNEQQQNETLPDATSLEDFLKNVQQNINDYQNNNNSKENPDSLLQHIISAYKPETDTQNDSDSLAGNNTTDMSANSVSTPTQTPIPNITPAPKRNIQAVDADPNANASSKMGGNTTRIRTMKGTEVDARYRIIDANDLIASTNDMGGPNPNYPQELQPRQRDRMTSHQQIGSIAMNLDPELPGENRLASDGAPVIGSDLVVESGNGRVLAIRMAYRSGKAENYRKWLKNNAAYFGLNPDEIDSIQNPVLVRERLTDVDRVKFTSEANEASIAQMSATENAFDDAKKITPDMLRLYNPDNPIEDNRDFISAFSRIIPQNERGDFKQANGKISKAGLDRIENALLALAYNNTDILNKLKEQYDDNSKNISTAIINAAPKIAILENGAYRKDLSIRNDIVQAVQTLARIRAEGWTVDTFLNQLSFFDDISPEAKRILLFLDKHKRGHKNITAMLSLYADLAMEQGKNDGQITLPGLEDSIHNDSKTDLLKRAMKEIDATFKANDGMLKSTITAITSDNSDTNDDTKSQNFKDWFGDWENDSEHASKATDDYGRPIHLFHGTDAEIPQGEEFPFAIFNVNGKNNSTVDTSGTGAWFHSNRKAAKTYGKFVYDVYLDIKNPYIVSVNRYNQDQILRQKEKIVRDVKAGKYGNGYDGVIFYNIEDVKNYFDAKSADDVMGDVYVVFRREQVKSATHNNGNYSRQEQNIFRQTKNNKNKNNSDNERIRLDFKQQVINAGRSESEADAISRIFIAGANFFSKYAGISLNDYYKSKNLSFIYDDDQNEKDNRGNSEFKPRITDEFGRIIREEQNIIRMFQNANTSTPVHEIGHFFLKEMRNLFSAGKLSGQALQDWVTLTKWLGVDDIDFNSALNDNQKALWTNAHEKFAAGFEKYIMTGKAPTQALKRVFEAFKRWLTSICYSIRNIQFQGTDERMHSFNLTRDVTQVFDRLLSTENDIASANENAAYSDSDYDTESYAQNVKHGSGNIFQDKKFDLTRDKGRNEIWGAHFSDDEATAAKYRGEGLPNKGRGTVKIKTRFSEYNSSMSMNDNWTGQGIDEARKEALDDVKFTLIQYPGIKTESIKRDLRRSYEEALKRVKDPKERKKLHSKILALSVIQDISLSNARKGNIYDFDIPENEDMLNLDAPIEKQSHKIYDAARSVMKALEQWNVPLKGRRENNIWFGNIESGRSFYSVVVNAMKEYMRNNSFNHQKYGVINDPRMAASLLLDSFGIRGAYTKSFGSGTGRNFTVWNEDAIKFLGVEGPAEQFYRDNPDSQNENTLTIETPDDNDTDNLNQSSPQNNGTKYTPENKTHADNRTQALNDNVSVAQELERKGKDKNAILMATGLVKDDNGNWQKQSRQGIIRTRNKIPAGFTKELQRLTDKAAVRNEHGAIIELDKSKLSPNEQHKLEFIQKKMLETSLQDSLDDDALFDAYPQLRNVKYSERMLPKGVNAITGLENGEYRITVNTRLNSKNAYNALMQEVQRVIQNIEGLTQIGNQFDEANESEAYNQFIGVPAAKRLDQQEGSTLRMDNYQIARNMERAGKHTHNIWLATGWGRGIDRKWRMEIMDGKINRAKRNELRKLHREQDALLKKANYNPKDKTLDASLLSYDERKRLSEIGNILTDNNLDKLLDNPDLFDAYPELRNIWVYEDDLPDGVYGQAIGNNIIVLNKKLNSEQFYSTLLHEIQHIIQNIEGFAHGSNEDIFKKYTNSNGLVDINPFLAKAFKRRAETIYRSLSPKLRKEFRNLRRQETKLSMSEFDELIHSTLSRKEAQQFREFIGADNTAEMYRTGMIPSTFSTPYYIYESSAGEVESRNVQKRRNMTLTERRLTPPDLTEDRDRFFESPKGEQFIIDSYGQPLSKKKDISEIDVENESYNQNSVLGFSNNGNEFIDTPEQQLDKVRQQYQGTDKWMKAPNSKKSNLTEKQWLQVRTPNFKRWFGDWENNPQNASKVLDDNGEPLVVYHGTPTGWFNAFNTSGDGMSKGTGAWFTPNKNVAALYYGKGTPTSKVYAVFINMRNPYVLDAQNRDWNDLITVGRKHFSTDDIVRAVWNGVLGDKHNDGVVFKNVKDPTVSIDEYILRIPNNVKSATHNNGLFSNEDNIYHQSANNLTALDSDDFNLSPEQQIRIDDEENYYNEHYNQPSLGKQDSIRDVIDIMHTDLGKKNSGSVWADYAKVSPDEAKRISEATGLDINDKYVHTIIGSSITHTLNRHGIGKEKRQDQLPITDADFERIPDIIQNADEITRGIERVTGGNNDTIVYKKRINGHVLVVEEVRNRRGKLMFHTMRKSKAGYDYDLSHKNHPVIKNFAKSEGVTSDNEATPEVQLPNALSNNSLNSQNYSVNDDNPETYNQIIGEIGAAALDDEEGTTWRMDFLQTAKNMTQKGETPTEIKAATNWELGADGKWKFEIVDGKIIPDSLQEFIEGYGTNDFPDVWLSEIFDAPELYTAYPEIADTPVIVKELRDGIAMKVNDGRIFISTKILDYPLRDMQSSLLHEIQHNIQSIEGFAIGDAISTKAGSLLNTLINKIKEAHSPYKSKIIKALEALDDNKFDLARKLFNSLPRYEKSLCNNFLEIYYQYRKEAMPYLNNAGENEARNVQRREHMTLEERKNHTLESTEDTPRKYQIVHFDEDNVNYNQIIGINDAKELYNTEDESYFQIGAKRKNDMDKALAKSRPDLTQKQRAEAINEIEKLGESVHQGGNPKVEKLATHWLMHGHVILPEDNYKIIDAIRISEQHHLDPMRFDDPNEILAKYTIKESNAEKRINPDSIPEFSNKVQFDNGITVYNVDDSEEGQLAVRHIIDTHWGEDANPWCLAARYEDDEEYGELVSAWSFWNQYDGIPKRIAFRNGKLIAFSANHDKRIVWWDREDNPLEGIPYSVKENGNIFEYAYNEPTRKSVKLKETLSDGTIHEWSDNGDLKYAKLPDGTIRFYYNNGQVLFEVLPDGTKRIWHLDEQIKTAKLPDGTTLWDKKGRQLEREILPDGTLRQWYKNGQLQREKFADGTERSFYENGKLEFEKLADGTKRMFYENGNIKAEELPDGTLRTFDENGQFKREIVPLGTRHNVNEQGQLTSETYNQPFLRAKKQNETSSHIDEHKSVLHINDSSIPQQQLDDVRKQYQGTSQWLKAPNGKKSNLNERQWLQVRTPNFKRWFGDWENHPENASKILDENGEPLVLYHGTPKGDFSVFDTKGHKKTKGTGAWFTPDIKAAEFYADASGSDNHNKQIYPVFLNIRNPYIHDAQGKYWEELGDVWIEDNEGFPIYHKNDGSPFINEEDAIDYLRDVLHGEDEKDSLGYYRYEVQHDTEFNSTDDIVRGVWIGDLGDRNHDGVIFKNVIDPNHIMDDYIIPKNTQVKSAVRNNGEFSDNPDIYHQAAYKPKETIKNLLKGITSTARNIFSSSPANKQNTQNLRFKNDETEKRYTEGKKGIQKEGIVQKIKNSTLSLLKSLRGDFPELSGNEAARKELLFAKEQFRLLHRRRFATVHEAMSSFTRNLRGLSDIQKDLFARKRLLDDLLWRKQNTPDAELPFGFDSDMLEREHKRFSELVKQDKKVADAIKAEEETMQKISDEFIKLAGQLGVNLEDALRNPHYYRHTILEYANAAALGLDNKNFRYNDASLQQLVDSELRKITRRDYLKKFKGSPLDINTNYIQANGEVRAQMLTDIQVMKTLLEIKKRYDIAPKLREQLKKVFAENQNQANSEIHSQSDDDSALSDILPDGYTLWDPAGSRLISSANSTSENILSMAIDDASEQSGLPIDRIFSFLGDFGENALNRLCVIPNEVAEALTRMGKKRDRGMLGDAARTLTNWWKKIVLFSPTRNLKYNFRNFTGDLDAVISGNPKALRFFGRAVKELTDYYRNRNATQDLQDYIERSGGMRIESLNMDNEGLKKIQNVAEKISPSWNLDFKNLPADSWNLIKDFFAREQNFTAWREHLLRYAAYLSYKQDMDSNNGTPLTWGASVPDEVMNVDDVRDRAYKMSNELLGAYDQISETGKQLRDMLIPFWSWQEVNLKRYYRLIQNGMAGRNPSGLAKRLLLAKSARIPFYAIAATDTFGKIALLTLITQMFNRFVMGDDDDELPPDVKYKPHITLGKVDGQVYYFDRIGALGDAADWLALDSLFIDAKELRNGQLSMTDYMKKIITAPVGKFLNSVNPFFRLPYEVMLGRSLFPDPSRPTNIQDSKKYIAQAFGLTWPYKAITGEPHSNWDEFKNLFVYGVDADEAAYFYALDKVREFQERVLGKSFNGFATSKRGQVLRKLKTALRLHDNLTVRECIKEYEKLAGKKKDESKNTQGLKTSMKSMNPLFGLSDDEQKKFMRWLDNEDKVYLRRADKYFHRLADKYIK